MRRAAQRIGMAALVALVAVVPRAAQGQMRIQIQPNGQLFVPETGQALPGHPLFVTDREMTQRLHQADGFLKNGQPAAAVIALQKILDQPEDSFYQPDRENDAQWHSLKLAAEQRLAALPREGREAYEMEFGFAARQVLEDARRAGRPDEVARLARRFLYTAAGRDAMRRLAVEHFDRGQWAAAAMRFEQLRSLPADLVEGEPLLSLRTAVCWGRAGLPRQAVRILEQLKDRTPADSITLGGRAFPLFQTVDDALPWLAATLGTQQEFAGLENEGWTMFRGNAARNAASAEVSPLWLPVWRTATLRPTDGLENESLDRAAAELRQLDDRLREDGIAVVPAMHPLILGDQAVFRTMQNVRAASLTTGEPRCETIIYDDAYEQLLVSEPSAGGNQIVNSPLTPREMFLMQRAWRDLTAGTLSSDGKHLFSVEELGFLGYPYASYRSVQHPLAPREFNKLMAFELAGELKLKWEVGGPPQSGLPLAGTFFLGPPLPLAGQLYCLGEGGQGKDAAGQKETRSGEVRLLVLDPETGTPLWEQALLFPQEDLMHFAGRRLAGLSPAFADGVVVCPAAAGAVVAVDLPRRALLWGYRYATNLPDSARARAAQMRFQMQGRWGLGMTDEERWIDSAPTVADGRVILTPSDSNDLHCIGLKDGAVQWKRPRGQGLYVAGVFDGRVIVVGRNQVEAWNLADGTPAWPQMVSIPLPSGRGVRTGDKYHLPLSTGEIATIDLTSGRLLARSKLPDGQMPGNLVAAAGRMISQTPDALVALEPLAAVEQRIADALAKDADDTEALALRGELRLHRGRTDDGLADLRRVIAAGENPRARQLVVDTLLEGLRLDFARYRDRIDEIDGLLADPRQRAEFVRLHAVGLHKAGEPVAAFREYVKLVWSGDEPPSLEIINGSLAVRGDRWVRPRIADLYAHATAEQRETMDRLAREQLREALARDDVQGLRSFLDGFAALPLATEARRALVSRLDPEEDAAELELELGRLRRSDDPPTAAEATARLARLLIDNGSPRDAAPLVAELADRWSDTVALEQRTGRQWAEQWRGDKEIAAALAPAPAWPPRQFEATREDRGSSIDRAFGIELLGRPGPYYEGWNFSMDSRRQNVVAADGTGAERWKLAIARTGRSIYQTTNNVAHAVGHLLVLDFGNVFAVVDPLSQPDEPKVLWTQDLYEKSAITGMNNGLNAHWAAGPAGVRRRVVRDVYNRPLGTLGPITADALVYCVGSELTAADPLTGAVLWQRRNIPRDSEVFGDGELVFVAAPDSTQATVLRMSDGEAVATRAVPPENERLTTAGRLVLSWHVADGRGRLAGTDIWTGQTAWQREFAEAALVQIIKGNEIGVLEPSGRFTVLNLADGQPRVESDIQRVPAVISFHVRRTRDRYILLTHSAENGVVIQSWGQNSGPCNGPVYGFDRATGKQVWATDVGRQGFDLTQPEDLPLLVFTSRRYNFGAPGLRPFDPQNGADPSKPFTLLVLDTRNGATIYRSPGGEAITTAPFETMGDPQAGTATLRLGQATLHLTLTDDPLAKPAELPPAAEDKPEE